MNEFEDLKPDLPIRYIPTVHDEVRSWAWDGLLVIFLCCLAALCIAGTFVAIGKITEPEPKPAQQIRPQWP
jgi:hypothetical protein